MNYQIKYLKYKKKYISLKQQLAGSYENKIVFNEIVNTYDFKNTFTKYMYNLVKDNIELLNLLQYDENHFFRNDIFRNYMDKIMTEDKRIYKHLQLYEHIFDNVKYINIQNIVDIIDMNINEINTTYSDHIPILLYSSKGSIYKSNFYFLLYFIYRYTIINKKIIENIFIDLNSILTFQNDNYEINDKLTNLKNKKLLFIICDDAVYSGTQIKDHNFLPFKSNYIKLNDNIKIYLNIISITHNAINNINKIINNIIIPKNIILVDTFINILLDYYKIERVYQLEELNERISELKERIKSDTLYKIKPDGSLLNLNHTILSSLDQELNKTLTYLDFKYPDFVSIYQHLCYFNIEEYNQGYYIEEKNISDLTNDIIKFIKSNKDNPDKITEQYKWIIYIKNDLYFYDKDISTEEQLNKLQEKNMFNYEMLNMSINLINKTENTNYCSSTIQPFYKNIVYINVDINNINTSYKNFIKSIEII